MLDLLQDERTQLMWQQEILQAELKLALSNYRPKMTIGLGMGEGVWTVLIIGEEGNSRARWEEQLGRKAKKATTAVLSWLIQCDALIQVYQVSR